MLKRTTKSNTSKSTNLKIIDETIVPSSQQSISTSKPLNFQDITANLQSMKCKILHMFGVHVQGLVVCSFMLVTTQQGYEFMLKLPHIACENVLICTETSANIGPEELRQNFIDIKKDLSTEICILSHLGIDTLGGINGRFEALERVVQSLNRGLKFYQAMPLVDYKIFVSDLDNNTLHLFLDEHADTALFREVLNNSSSKNLLLSNGPYTVLAPSNKAMSKEYGRDLLKLDKTKSSLNTLTANHIFKGTYDANFSGEIVNLNGDKVLIENGKIKLGNDIVKDYDAQCKINGNVCVIDSVIKSTPKVPYSNNIEGTGIIKISPSMIANACHRIWIAQNNYDNQVLSSIKAQLQIMLNKITEFEEISIQLKPTEQKILEADNKYNDLIHVYKADHIAEMNSLSARIKDMVNKYQDHMKTGSILIAAEQLLQVLTKLIRDA